MKVLRIILVIVAVLLAIPFITALFVPHDYTVERQIVINRPASQVFGFVKMLRNQVQYSKWYRMDPNAVMTYSGVDGTPGFVSGWDSKVKEVGKGEQVIRTVTEGKRLDLDIHFFKPMNGEAQAYISTDSTGMGQTTVKWGFSGHMKYPFNFMLVVMNMDKMLGDDLTVGLTNLKGIMEK